MWHATTKRVAGRNVPAAPTSNHVMEDLARLLPPWLHERCDVRSPLARTTGGIVYWMRVAVRDRENPALDVALHLAHALGAPLLVFHALSQRYPYASDRHHTFILEGARDVHRAFAARNISYAFHLERPGADEPVLRTLAATARIVVTELCPVPPLRGWTDRLAEVAPVLGVDASCLFPLPAGPAKAPARAFSFRQAAAPHVQRWLGEAYPASPAAPAPWTEPLPFTPVELATADLSDLVARCAIDHGVGVVPDSPGGMAAAHARWTAFLGEGAASGLGRYAATRNDPLVDGTSRMSPYLHYGHASPFTLARDAHARRKTHPGATKYLDELLVWRELAWHYCHRTEELHGAAAIPAWARATLAAHEADPRPALPSWDVLARGHTADALWNAAQRSLLVHGELHNNLRMTWGKQLLAWTQTGSEALELLVDLNHRYALDGRDPASYGGLLWCLGAFDRPFTPEVAILGTVRPRPTGVHARRLPLAAYERLVARAPVRGAPRVLVIGSGIAGLAAARTLANHNVEVVVMDKGRRPGGRLASRELAGTVFDYGAQYFTARSPAFRQLVGALAWEGVLATWAPRLGLHDAAGLHAAAAPVVDEPWYVAPRGFAAFAGRLADGLAVRQSTHVVGIERTPTGWEVAVQNAPSEPFTHVLITVPLAQALPLVPAELRARWALDAAAAEPRHEPCWSLSLELAAPLAVPFDAIRSTTSDIAWLAREASKPGRAGASEVWTLHAARAFSLAELETDPPAVTARLRAAFGALVGAAPVVGATHAHRWRYARATPRPPEDLGYRHDAASGLGLAGDAIAGPRLELAYLSGIGLAGACLRDLAAAGAPDRPAAFARADN